MKNGNKIIAVFFYLLLVPAGLYASVINDSLLVSNAARAIEPSDSIAGYTVFEDEAIEPLPILSYDTDAGLGYGAKVFILNKLKLNESFDILLFNSTKGERWYRLVFSVPDYEHRQGKVYPISFDIALDYDKLISAGYYGTGSSPAAENRETYTKKMLNISFDFSRGFTPELIGQFGIKYKSSANSNIPGAGILSAHPDPLCQATVKSNSVYLLIRYDTRNSYVNPEKGIILQGTYEYAFKTPIVNAEYSYFESSFHYYTNLLFPKTTFAFRSTLQSVTAKESPVQILLPLGGNKTLRGYPQDRFLDKALTLVNSELRFPIYKRLGGVAGFDIGKVWPSVKKINLAGWVSSPVAGLRFHMDNFIVRLDAGFSSETMGIYLNFNHVF